MNVAKFKPGDLVWYHPVIGEDEGKLAGVIATERFTVGSGHGVYHVDLEAPHPANGHERIHGAYEKALSPRERTWEPPEGFNLAENMTVPSEMLLCPSEMLLCTACSGAPPSSASPSGALDEQIAHARGLFAQWHEVEHEGSIIFNLIVTTDSVAAELRDEESGAHELETALTADLAVQRLVFVLEERLASGDLTHAEELFSGILRACRSGAHTNEGTAYPYWVIARRRKNSEIVLLAGVWFSREAAEEHLENKAHRYPKSAFVWCDSAHASFHLRMLHDLAAVLADGTLSAKKRRDRIIALHTSARAAGYNFEAVNEEEVRP